MRTLAQAGSRQIAAHPSPDMALSPCLGMHVHQHLAPSGARPFTTGLHARQEWAQLRTERAASAAFASTSGGTDGRRRAGKQAAEEQQERRRRAEAKQAGLRSVAGIGPKNEQRLLSKGISSVDSLSEVFNDHKKRDEEKMLSYLQVRTGSSPGRFTQHDSC